VGETPLTAAALTATLTLALCPPVIAMLRRHALIDLPSQRRTNSVATPRGGGIAPASAVLLVLLAGALGAPAGRTWTALIVAAAAFAAVGVAEDLRGVRPLRRLLLQLAGAVPVVALVVLPAVPSRWWALVCAVGVIWLVSYVNCFNFMDGINGISGVTALVTGTVWALVGAREGVTGLAWGGAVTAAAGAAFLPYNLPRARVFLGDTGSYFFGGLIGALALVALTAGISPLVVVAPLLLALLDTGTTLVRRVWRHEPWSLPHRDHVYQRVTTLGWTHTRSAVVFGVLSALASVVAVIGSRATPAGQALTVLALAVLSAGYLALPRLLRRSAVAAPLEASCVS